MRHLHYLLSGLGLAVPALLGPIGPARGDDYRVGILAVDPASGAPSTGAPLCLIPPAVPSSPAPVIHEAVVDHLEGAQFTLGSDQNGKPFRFFRITVTEQSVAILVRKDVPFRSDPKQEHPLSDLGEWLSDLDQEYGRLAKTLQCPINGTSGELRPRPGTAHLKAGGDRRLLSQVNEALMGYAFERIGQTVSERAGRVETKNNYDARKLLQADLVLLRGTLEDLEDAGVLPADAAEILHARLAEVIPTAMEHVLFYAYGFISPEKVRQIDIVSGMRLRVEYEAYQIAKGKTDASGHVGTGVSYYLVSRQTAVPSQQGAASRLKAALKTGNEKGGILPPDTGPAGHRDLIFDPFFGYLQSKGLSPGLEKSQLIPAGGIADLHLNQAARRYCRLHYPDKPLFPSRNAGPDDINDPDDTCSLYTADTTWTLEKDDFQQYQGRKPHRIFFRGRTMIVPEIQVFIQGRAVFVPVGTTVRQALSADRLWTPGELLNKLIMERPFGDGYRPVRFALPDYRSFELPLVQGDRLRWQS
jgi:hypothetical protein